MSAFLGSLCVMSLADVDQSGGCYWCINCFPSVGGLVTYASRYCYLALFFFYDVSGVLVTSLSYLTFTLGCL